MNKINGKKIIIEKFKRFDLFYFIFSSPQPVFPLSLVYWSLYFEFFCCFLSLGFFCLSGCFFVFVFVFHFTDIRWRHFSLSTRNRLTLLSWLRSYLCLTELQLILMTYFIIIPLNAWLTTALTYGHNNEVNCLLVYQFCNPILMILFVHFKCDSNIELKEETRKHTKHHHLKSTN